MRANGSGECPPDDRLREAIQSDSEGLDCFVATLLAMTKKRPAQRAFLISGRVLLYRTVTGAGSCGTTVGWVPGIGASCAWAGAPWAGGNP